MQRREFISGAAWATLGTACSRLGPAPLPLWSDQVRLNDALDPIAAAVGGRLGVAMHDLESGHIFDRMGFERFPLLSTFKVLAAGAVLSRVDAGRDQLERSVRFTEADLVEYSPVTEKRTGGLGMTLAELCEAAITRSDNTAGNLLLANIGGPAGLTAFARSLGDRMTRLDRIEPDLNEALPGDARDTTTPSAMAHDLQRLVLGSTLSAPSRAKLASWLVASQTGDKRIRAGVPSDWQVGDKTGTGERGTANDIAVLWRADKKPLILCVYLTGSPLPIKDQNEAIAAVARVLTSPSTA